MTHPKLDDAALKADPSDSEIMEIAGRWFHTGDNQHRTDGYYYRSLGTPTNVRGSDLIEFARALLHRSQPVAVVPAEQAEDSAMLDAIRENSWELRCFDMPTGQGDADIGWKVMENHMDKPYSREVACVFKDDPRAAIRAAIGRNREAGGS